jgi:hypothetical protein
VPFTLIVPRLVVALVVDAPCGGLWSYHASGGAIANRAGRERARGLAAELAGRNQGFVLQVGPGAAAPAQPEPVLSATSTALSLSAP